MGNYIPGSRDEQQKMLEFCGLTGFGDLYRDIPEAVLLKGELNLPSGMPELKVRQTLEKIASDNVHYQHVFRGAGSYRHYIPEIVSEITGRREFLTAYTPYQAEISQGVLQSIFEYQTAICSLTGMDASNASVYDGATACAEACEMCHERKRSKIIVSGTVDPKILSVVRTYSFGRDAEVCVISEKNGETDPEALRAALTPDTSCVLIQQPNYYGIIEQADIIAEMAHEAGAKLIMSVNPVSLAILKTPAEYGADIAVGEGQPLGIPMGSGGPYIGFMAATSKMMRKLPGRIVGQTEDVNGKRGYVLTLQAREQHIRREKASSNICSNEALCAMRVSIYLAAMGPEGLREAARQCVSKAHYLKDRLVEAGLSLAYDKPFFHEFVTSCSKPDRLLEELEKQGILGGLPLGDGRILWCATEMNTREEMDQVAGIAKEVQNA